jgi:hypothetical protein
VITYTGILLILIRHSAQSEIAGQRFAHNAREVPTSDSMVEVRPELVLDAIWNWGEIRTRSDGADHGVNSRTAPASRD